MKSESKARILVVTTILAIIGTGFLPEEHWLANVGILVHVWTWALLILAFFGAFMEDLPEYKPWFAIPTTIGWICALAFVGWTVALGLYAIISLIAIVRRLNL
jgi:hypothetical protein